MTEYRHKGIGVLEGVIIGLIVLVIVLLLTGYNPGYAQTAYYRTNNERVNYSTFYSPNNLTGSAYQFQPVNTTYTYYPGSTTTYTTTSTPMILE